MNCEEVEEQTEKTFHSAKLCVTSISLTEHMGTDVDWQTRKFSEKSDTDTGTWNSDMFTT